MLRLPDSPYRDLFLADMAAGGIAGPAVLASLNFTAPVAQSLPSTPAALATAMGTAKTADRVLLFNGSGDVTDSAGSTWTKHANILTQRKACGLYDGSSMAPQIAYESDPAAGVSPLSAPNASIGDSDTASVAVLVVFRASAYTTDSVLFGKRDSGSPNRGWEVYLDTSGKLTVTVDDDVSTASNSGAISNHDDGAWHYAVAYIDRTSDTCGAFSDLGTSTPGSISGLTTLTNTSTMGFLGQRIAAGPRMQIAYAAIFTGSNAEGLTTTIVNNWWKLGSDPTGKLTTYTRANGTIADSVTSSGDVAIYSGYSAAAQIAYGYKNGSLGLRLSNVITNRIVDSVNLANATYWANSGTPTVTHNAADAPSGVRAATLITSDNVSYYRVATVAASAGSVTVSWWAKGGSAHNARLVIANASAVVKDTYDYAVTTSWQRFSRTFTYDGSTANIQIRWHGSDDGTSRTIYIWGPQSTNDAYLHAYAPNKGAVVACPGVSVLYDAGSTKLADPAKGELAVLASANTLGSASNRYLGWLREAPGTITGANDSEKLLYLSTADKSVGFIYNADGSLANTLVPSVGVTVTDQILYRLQWDNTDTLDGTNHSRVWDGTTWTGNATVFTSGEDLCRLWIGNSAGSLSAQGVIHSITTYAGPNN